MDAEHTGDRGPRVAELDALREDCRLALDQLPVEDLHLVRWILLRFPTHRLRAELEAATAAGFEAPGEPRAEPPSTPSLTAKRLLWATLRKVAPFVGVDIALPTGGKLGIVASALGVLRLGDGS